MPEALTEKKITDFRKRICDVATRQFGEKGIENVSMRSLAKELGYSATALYSYYKNKDDILAATRTAALDRLSTRLVEALQRCDEPAEHLRILADAYADFAFGEPAAYKLVFSPQQPAQKHYPELERAQSHLHHILAGCMKQLADKGFVNGNPQLLARMALSTMHGAIFLKMAGKLEDPEFSFRQVYSESLRLLTLGATSDSPESNARKESTNEQFSLNL